MMKRPGPLASTLIGLGLLLQCGAACEQSADFPTTTTPSADDSATADFNISLEDCELTATDLESDVDEASYYEESNDGTTRTILANGIANHDVDSFPNTGNPNEIAPQSYTYRVPVTPSGAGEAVPKTFGIAISGVVLEPGTAERWNNSQDWSYEALRYGTAPTYFATQGGSDNTHHPTELGLDCNFAHVQPNGAYHYHGVPTGLMPDAPALSFVGWAADGYPIFGRWGHVDADDASSALTEMTSSYRLKEGTRPSGPGGTYDGTFVQDWEYEEGRGDLDACNGRVGTVTIDGEQITTYHYYLTYTFPYIPRCWAATPDASFAAGPPM